MHLYAHIFPCNLSHFQERKRSREINYVPEKKRAFLAEERRDLAAREADLQIWELISLIQCERTEKSYVINRGLGNENLLEDFITALFNRTGRVWSDFIAF